MSVLCMALLQVQHALSVVVEVLLSLPGIVLGAMI